MHVFFSAGEPSGDQHAAQVIRQLRGLGAVRVSGFGGPHMEAAGCSLLFPLTTMAVIGFLRVIPMIRKFYGLVKEAEAYFDRHRPDLVVLVDFPGFNWHIAKAAKKRGIPVVYYLPPQLWAWASWRIRRVRKNIDLVLSGLPFEAEWYASRGIPTLYVGHPFFDEVKEHPLDESFCREWKTASGPTIAILPGSRTQEVQGCWPIFREAMTRLVQKFPHVRFLVANYKEAHRVFCRSELMAAGSSHLPISFFVGKTSEVIELADCGMMASGSVSLEMLARRTPAAVIYRCSRLTYIVGRILVHVKYMSLPNLIARRELMPEKVSVGSPEPTVEHIVEHLERWLSDPRELPRIRGEFEKLHEQIGSTGAAHRVATLLLDRYGHGAQEQKAAA